MGYLEKPDENYRLEAGDILYSHINSVLHMGKVALYEGGLPLYHGMNLMLLRPKVSDVIPKFLFLVLASDIGRSYARRECKSAISQASLSQGQISNLELDIPEELGEQQKVIEILDTLDTAIRETEALIDKLKAVKQGLLHDLLTRGIDASGQLRPRQSEAPQLYKESPLGWIPKEWDVQSLENLVANGSPITYGVVQPGPEVDGGILFIRGGDIYGGKILVEQLRTISTEVSNSYRRTQLVGGELLMSLVGYPGEVALVPSKLAGANIARQAALIRLDNTVFSMFVMYYLSSTDGKRQVLGQSLGSAQQVVNLSDLRCVKVPLPPRDEQEVIASRVSVSQEKIEQEIVELGKLLEVKAGLMDDLLTGRVRVTPLLEASS